MKHGFNFNEVPERFERSIRTHGARMDLNSLSAIGRYLGFEERAFNQKVKRMAFKYVELLDLFKRLHYTDEEKLELMTI